jgi:glycosyltransferase involved in cell wall biosynthesis
MRIAEVIATFPPHHGGMGYVCYHNSLQLAARGHEVTVFTLEHGRLVYDNDPREFRIIRMGTPFLYGDAGVTPQLSILLKSFDVVHLHYPFFGGAEYVFLSSLLHGSKYFLTYHMDVRGATFIKKLLIGSYTALLLKHIVRKARLVGALTIEHLKNSEAARFVDWNKVVEMPNGVDTKLFSPRTKSRDLTGKYGLDDRIVILFVGNLQPFKGLHVLIEAMAKIPDERIMLIIVGGGYGEAEYQKRVHDMGLNRKILFAGPQSPDKNLPQYYNLCDFLVLPSTYSESFGLVVLEAMASGKPAIVSSLPGPSQLIDDGKDGLIAKAGDSEDLKTKIEYLAANPELRRDMGAAAREKAVRKYSWNVIGGHLERTLISMARE